ncbi:hypothetical protein ACWDSL_48045 [Streptomyces sp. NPDC000941]
MSPTRLLTAVLTTALLTAGAAVPAVAAPAAGSAAERPLAAADWQQTLADGESSLLGVAQPDSHTTWAAGVRVTYEGRGSKMTPLLMTRDGSGGWTETPTAPLDSRVNSRANAITATSAQDGWIVGDGSAALGGILTEHWNGTSWEAVTAPAPENTEVDGGGLLGVSGRSADDVWAVGWVQLLQEPDSNDSPFQGLAEHWDGTSWTIMPLPDVAQSWVLNAVTAIAPDDVWAVGTDMIDDQPILLHYDGRSWKQTPTPSYKGINGEFNSVAAYGPNDVWAAGRAVLDEDDRGHALLAHWDGHAWKQVATPADAGTVRSVTAAPGGPVTVGSAAAATDVLSESDAYGMRWTGYGWRNLALPTASGTERTPSGAVVSKTGITVVGSIATAESPAPRAMVLTTC